MSDEEGELLRATLQLLGVVLLAVILAGIVFCGLDALGVTL